MFIITHIHIKILTTYLDEGIPIGPERREPVAKLEDERFNGNGDNNGCKYRAIIFEKY